MDLNTRNQIPCIDFTKDPKNLEQGSEGWKHLCNQVRDACEVYGSFQVLYNKVPSDLCQDVFNECKGLFDLPLETKLKNLNPKPYFGYLGNSNMLPFYEGFGIEDAPLPGAVQAFSDLMWPHGNSNFCKTLHSISIKLQELELIVLKMLCAIYGVEEQYKSLAESTQNLFRVMKYKLPSHSDSAVVLGAHTDKGSLTILCQDGVQGLQVLSKENEWLEVGPFKEAFIVFMGETLKAWSNGRLYAVKHRVMMIGQKERKKKPIFSNRDRGSERELKMGFKAEAQIPCFDFGKDLVQGGDGWKNLSKQVREACEVYGVFQVVYDQIPSGLCEEMIKASEELFDLPDEMKVKNKGSRPFYGYIGKYDEVPLYESLGIEDAPALEAARVFTQLMWPDGNPLFCKTVNSISSRMHELGLIVLKLIMESYGVEKYFNSYVESNETVFRMMKYKAPKCNTSEVALAPHIDKSAITVLCQNPVNGLEVLFKEENWIPVEPLAGSFTVFVGDALKAWSNGRLHAVKHRVMMRGDKARYSFALFSSPKEAVMMESPKELVDEEHPRLFRPFKYADFLNHYYTTYEDNNALDVYAAV